MQCLKEFTISVASVCFNNASPLPDGFLFVAYSVTLTTPLGAGTFSITSGALPDNLILNPASGLISGTPDAEGLFSFTATFTPDVGEPCSKNFTITIGIYCVAIEDLTWSISDTHAPETITVEMAGGDGSYSINRGPNNNGFKRCILTSSQLLCLPPVFEQYAATVEVDWSVNADANAGAALDVLLNGVPKVPALTIVPNTIDSDTLTVSLGMLQAGVTYIIAIRIDTNCVSGGSVLFSGTIRVRPLTPP